MTDNQQYNQQNQQDDNERRKFFRLDMEEELIDVSWQNESGQRTTQRIACLDFSKGGLKLACDQPIPLNTQVEVCFQAANKNSQLLLGQVIRQISKANGCFEIALRLNTQ